MSSQPTRRTRRQEREFQANRQKMDEYVYLPSERAAAYFWQIGIGASCAIVGLFIRATYAGAWFVMLYTVLIAASVPFMATGLGGLFMLNRRLYDYRGDILDNRRVDVEEETFHYGDEPTVETRRPLAVNKGGKVKTTIEVDDPQGFHPEELRSFAVAVLCHKTGMTKDAITKKTSRKHNPSWPYWKVSQPKWDKITKWMIKHKLATVDLGKTELNGAGYDHLLKYVPEHERGNISLVRPKG